MATEADCCIVATPTSTQGRRAHTREVQHRSPRRAAPTSHLRSRHGGSRGGEAAAPAHHQYGSWVAAPRTATSGAGASAAQRRVQAGASESRAATDSPRRPAALAPRASRRRESGEVRARANWTFRAPRPPLGRPAPAVRRHAQARARSECGRPLRRGHRRWPRGSWLAAGGEATCGAQSAHGGRFPRRLLTGRAAWARYSARTRERRGERANWPPLTRPTVRGLAVVWSSTHAAGQKFRREARRSGTSWRGPLSAGTL